MNIAVLSGKGGTGKTTVATNLAAVLKCRYVDCDVEAPNGFLFLDPEITDTTEVAIPIPSIDPSKCQACGQCATACNFNALVSLSSHIMVLSKLCHGCGLCTLICPNQAISEQPRPIGKLELAHHNSGYDCWRGVLNIGEPMAGPVITQLLKPLNHSQQLSILDAPPGSSCSVVKVLNHADFALLVTEPTPFGLHDLQITVELVRSLQIPSAIVINRWAQDEEASVLQYAGDVGIPVIAKLPFSLEAAKTYANGKLLCETKEWERRFRQLAEKIREVSKCASS